MSATGRDLRESLNNGQSSGSENLMVYAAIAGVILVGAIGFVTFGLINQQPEIQFAEAQTEAVETVKNNPGLQIGSMNSASLNQELSQSVEVLKEYRSTLAKLQTCARGKERKKFDSIIASYEKRNANAVASWQPKKSKMYDKMQSGDASDTDLLLYSASGGMQRDVMADLAMTNAYIGISYETLSDPQCMKLSGDVRMKKFDIQPRPAG